MGLELLHLLDRHLAHLVIGRGKQVEVKYMQKNGTQYVLVASPIQHTTGQVVVEEAELLSALHEKVPVLVDEQPGHQITEVPVPIEPEGVAEEVVDVDHPEVSAVFVLAEITGSPLCVALVKTKNIGVHGEHHRIAGH